MIIAPFIYPLPDPVLTGSSVYEIPGSTLMVYSKGNPFLDTFFIPSRLIPNAISGHTFAFQTQHDSNIGLYPAMLLATSVFVTSNALYGFQDVTSQIIALIVTASTVTIGYKDVDTDTLVIISNVELVERLTITEDMTAVINPRMAIKKQLIRRQTIATNNLPFNITSHNLTSAAVPVIIYYPPDGTVYSYLTVRLKNTTSDAIQVSIEFSGPRPAQNLWFKVDSGDSFELKNILTVYSETVKLTALSIEPINIYVGAMHMEGKL